MKCTKPENGMIFQITEHGPGEKGTMTADNNISTYCFFASSNLCSFFRKPPDLKP